jgi:hypothetical protein
MYHNLNDNNPGVFFYNNNINLIYSLNPFSIFNINYNVVFDKFPSFKFIDYFLKFHFFRLFIFSHEILNDLIFYEIINPIIYDENMFLSGFHLKLTLNKKNIKYLIVLFLFKNKFPFNIEFVTKPFTFDICKKYCIASNLFISSNNITIFLNIDNSNFDHISFHLGKLNNMLINHNDIDISNHFLNYYLYKLSQKTYNNKHIKLLNNALNTIL